MSSNDDFCGVLQTEVGDWTVIPNHVSSSRFVRIEDIACGLLETCNMTFLDERVSGTCEHSLGYPRISRQLPSLDVLT